jgi:hypothetical protein
MYEYFVEKFRSLYSPKQELSLHEAMIQWWNRLKFKDIQFRENNKIWSAGENGA